MSLARGGLAGTLPGASPEEVGLRFAAMETFLVLNGFEIEASVNEQERLMLDLAAGKLGRPELASWLRDRVKPTG